MCDKQDMYAVDMKLSLEKAKVLNKTVPQVLSSDRPDMSPSSDTSDVSTSNVPLPTPPSSSVVSNLSNLHISETPPLATTTSPTNSSSLTLTYPTDESSMPSHVLAAHTSYTSSSPSCDAEASLVCPPKTSNTVLLHSCCAPCSGAMIHEMLRLNLTVSVVFYNPNIHPYKEYLIRKVENKKFCEHLNVPFIDLDTGKDYGSSLWFSLAKGMEGNPERGRRCTMCFDMRMFKVASYAKEHGFPVISTTNATSRWKDTKQVDGSGIRAAEAYGLEYWEGPWKSDRLTLLKYQISAERRFYKQEYCGCSYSLRDSNLWREKEGIPKVKIGGEEAGLGERYFTDAETDAEEESQEVRGFSMVSLLVQPLRHRQDKRYQPSSRPLAGR